MDDHVPVALVCAEPDRPAGRGELDGVAKQVGDRLDDPIVVSPHLRRAGLDHDPEASDLRRWAHHIGGLGEQLAGVARLLVEGDPAGCQALGIEDVVDQSDQPVRVRYGDTEHPSAGFRVIDDAPCEQAERGPDRGQWRPQLVADDRYELILHPVDGLLLADVASDDGDPRESVRVVADARECHRHVHLRAVLPNVDGLSRREGHCVTQALHRLAQCGVIVSREEDADRPSGNLGSGVAVESRGAGIPAHDRPVGPCSDDRISR